MASELYVETLKGLTSGANANKVIIPSGQTLDASAGTLTPSSGAVIQCQQFYNSSNSKTATSSTSLVASGFKKSITPKFADSLIIVQYSCSMADCNTNAWIQARMYVTVGSGSPTAMPGSSDYHVGYIEQTYDRYQPMAFSGQYFPTSTDTLEFEVYFQSPAGTEVSLAHGSSSCALTLWEIKQ